MSKPKPQDVTQVGHRRRSSSQHANEPLKCPSTPMKSPTKKKMDHLLKRGLITAHAQHFSTPDLSVNGSFIESPIKPPTEEELLTSQYEVISQLGQGSFSVVFKVLSKLDKQFYAIKRCSNLITSTEKKKQLEQEINCLLTLGSHPNCVQYLDSWQQMGYVYIRTELCEMDLTTYLRSEHNPISEPVIWRFLHDIANGLRHIHQHNLIHLDIKPDNILVSKNNLRIADFGNASSGLEPYESGDPKYMAPELLNPQQGIRSNLQSADVFSLGITIWEMVTDLESESSIKVITQLEGISSEIEPSRSTELRQLVRQMVHPDPEQRPTLDQILTHPCLAQYSSYPYLIPSVPPKTPALSPSNSKYDWHIGSPINESDIIPSNDETNVNRGLAVRRILFNDLNSV